MFCLAPGSEEDVRLSQELQQYCCLSFSAVGFSLWPVTDDIDSILQAVVVDTYLVLGTLYQYVPGME